MKHSRVTPGLFAALLNPLAVLSPLAVWSPLVGIAASLTGTLPASGVDVQFTERVISTNAINASSVFATDVDGDGDTDILSASFVDNKIAWYESDGGSPPAFTERVISTTALGAHSVFAMDVDSDGDTDVLSASLFDDKIAWYESDGGLPPTFIERVISTAAENARSVFATDMDGDGDTDVLSASRDDDKIAWYENGGGSPPTFTERVISTAAIGAFSVFATDVDGDGDTDVLSASSIDNKIAWYESDGGSPPTFTEHLISTAANGALSVFATDLDGDGDIDVLSASLNDDKIAWYESDGGSPPTFTERVISTTASGAFSVFARDVDGDGDTDVLSASFIDDKIAWYESDGASPPTFTQRVISIAADGVVSVFATDMDGDGDIDILSASRRDDKIAWYENTTPPCGNGSIDPTEECDDGGESVTCDSDCTVAECGDGTLNVTAGEECDGGLACTDCLCDADFEPTVPPSLDCLVGGPPLFSMKAVRLNPTCMAGDPSMLNEVCASDRQCDTISPPPFFDGVCGGNITPTNTVSANPGDIIVVEFFVSNWSPQGQKVRGYQVSIDDEGYFSGGGTLRPLGWDRPNVDIGCFFADCPPEWPVCTPEAVCAGVDHDPRRWAFTDKRLFEGDFILAGCVIFGGEDTGQLGYRYGRFVSGSFNCTQTFSPPPKYAGTLVLVLGEDAFGTFTLNFRPSLLLNPIDETALLDLDRQAIVPLELEGLTITICGDGMVEGVEACDDGNTADGDGCSSTCELELQTGIPTVSEWGLIVMALLLLAGAKVYFNRRRAARA